MHRPHLEFTLALQQQLPAGEDLCWSPYSVASALGMAAAGARGDTYDELVRVLAPGGELAGLVDMLTRSAALREADVAVANSLWLDALLRLQDDYRWAVRELPGGVVHSADFRSDPETARVAINGDVEHTTRGLIRELLAPGMISTETAAVLVNALYLKVAWLRTFPESATAPAPFQAPSGTRQVPTMRQQQSFGYAAAAGWRMVSLPTGGPAMVDVLLPDEGQPAALTTEAVTALQDAARPTKVDLTLPRFRVTGAAVLNSPLEQLGATTAFRPGRADFDGVTTDRRIFIDSVVHKAVLRVDEQGFEGAAATAVVMDVVSVDLSSPVAFHVDRPFLLLVRHARTGAVYFLARVTEPSDAD